MADFEVLSRETSSFSMNHLSSLLSANPASLFLHFTLDSSCPKHLIILSAAWTFTYLCLFNLSFFFLILQASAQVSIMVKTFSPPPERDSALTLVTPHYCVHLSDLSVRMYSKQQMSMMCHRSDKGLGTSGRFRRYPVFMEFPFPGKNYLLFCLTVSTITWYALHITNSLNMVSII